MNELDVACCSKRLQFLLQACLGIRCTFFYFQTPYPPLPRKKIEGAHFTVSAPGAENPSYATAAVLFKMSAPIFPLTGSPEKISTNFQPPIEEKCVKFR